ncbi:MAG: class I SAM-dependent methyltransferase [Candidatus Sungiibacteriota bacterium]|uniref:Class I SAM-dependent methyltransferase n=1 Tax=Candidatus Sungiibacteriota bacterium TaxID=2750080 RepID=A0A7T5RJQ5_9BACT|nr:MAG: class I SAM-dependent methyltransferase [Candidatus Sungbacteria bacterium]
MKQDYVQTIYNEKVRPKTSYPKKLTKYLIDRFRIPGGSLLLDVGCGRGDFTLGFKENGLEVEGLDSSDFSVSELGRSGIRVSKIDFSRNRWPFSDNSFDVVFSKSVIEHLPNPENFICESYRILRPGGRIITMTPDWKTGLRIFYDDYTHVHPYTTAGLRDLLLLFSFRQVSSEQFYQLPVIWKLPFLKIISWVLRRIMYPSSDINIKFIRWSLDLMVLGSGIK